MAVHGGSLRSAPTLLYSHMVVEIDQASVGYFGKRMGGGAVYRRVGIGRRDSHKEVKKGLYVFSTLRGRPSSVVRQVQVEKMIK